MIGPYVLWDFGRLEKSTLPNVDFVKIDSLSNDRVELSSIGRGKFCTFVRGTLFQLSIEEGPEGELLSSFVLGRGWEKTEPHDSRERMVIHLGYGVEISEGRWREIPSDLREEMKKLVSNLAGKEDVDDYTIVFEFPSRDKVCMKIGRKFSCDWTMESNLIELAEPNEYWTTEDREISEEDKKKIDDIYYTAIKIFKRQK